MKTLLTVAMLALTAGWAMQATAASQDDAMMAEMKKCSVCSKLTENPELMKNMTWETKKTDNGMVCVTTVPKDMKSQLKSLDQEMTSAMKMANSKKQQGQAVEVCPLCDSMCSLMDMSGVEEEEIEFSTGMIHMTTSDDPAMVQKIHAVADKAIAMQKQMAAK